MWKAEIRRIMVWSQPHANTSWDPNSKIHNTKKMAGRIVQVIECLLSKSESLSSITMARICHLLKGCASWWLSIQWPITLAAREAPAYISAYIVLLLPRNHSWLWALYFASCL
jgi:hypothetical protein